MPAQGLIDIALLPALVRSRTIKIERLFKKRREATRLDRPLYMIAGGSSISRCLQQNRSPQTIQFHPSKRKSARRPRSKVLPVAEAEAPGH